MTLIRESYFPVAAKHDAHDTIHRDQLLARMLRITKRTQRNNLIIIGESGVGKTALFHGLAFRFTHNPNLAQFKRPIITLDTTRLALLMNERDQVSLDAALTELRALRNTIIVLDDAHSLFRNDDTSALLFILQPLFERPDLSICIICGASEYRRTIEGNPIFARECEPLFVDELTIEQSTDVLLVVTATRHRTLGSTVADSTIAELVILAKRYVAERALPAKAVSLLDEAISKVIYEKKTTVSLVDIKQIIAEKTGIPIETLNAAEQEKLLHLEKELDRQIIGQPHVTRAVAKVIRRSRAGLKDPHRPIASFLFLGSSGVGKTELAKVLSTSVFHNERSLLRFDMSEFSESHTAQRLVGSPPGYIGFEEGGQLTNAVLAQPYSLILLDELEKAHPKIFDIFLQVMDDGRLTDGKGRTVDFSNTMIIATSNLVVDDILNGFLAGHNVTTEDWYTTYALPLLSTYFRPEFINRFDDTLVFAPFSPESIWRIAQLEVTKLRQRLRDLHIAVTLSEDDLRKAVQQLYKPQFGARPIRRYLQENIENSLAEDILRGTSKKTA